jgi:hypothetical protein
MRIPRWFQIRSWGDQPHIFDILGSISGTKVVSVNPVYQNYFCLPLTLLVTLRPSNIPHSGYISPETMVAVLSALTSLTEFTLSFRSPQSRPDRGRRRPPPSTHSVIPALTHIDFKGVSEYPEDLVARIDAPLLNRLEVIFSPHSSLPNSSAVHQVYEARVICYEHEAVLALPLRHRRLNFQTTAVSQIGCFRCWPRSAVLLRLARPYESVLGGAPPIGTCPESHLQVRCHATTDLQSFYSRLSMGHRQKTGQAVGSWLMSERFLSV